MDHADRNMGKWRKYLLIAIFILGAFLRFYKLGEKSLWFDEMHTLDDAFEDYNFWAQAHTLYFLLARFFLFFGHSEFWLRMASALFGSLGVLMIYYTAKEIFQDERVGIFSALMVALSRVHIHFSQEARYYPVMFFLAALSLFLFARFYRSHSLPGLLLLPFVCLLNYYIHPTTLPFSGILLAWVPFSLIVTSQGRAFVKKAWVWAQRLSQGLGISGRKSSGKKSLKGSPNRSFFRFRFVKIFVVFLILCILVLGAWSSMKIGRLIQGQAKQIKLFRAPADGVTASFPFFFTDHFIFYGPIVKFGGFPNTYLVILFILFSLVGYGRALFRHFIFGSFFLVSLFVTFSLLFSVPIKQWYSSKYIFFLYPGNVICIIYGFVSLMDGFSSIIIRSLKWKRYSWAVFAVPAFLFWGPQLYKDIKQIQDYYLWQGTNVKDAVRHVAKGFGPRDVLAAYGLTNGPVQYYTERFGIPSSQYLYLKWVKGDGSHPIQLLIKAAAKGGNVWYIFGWPHDIEQKPLLKNWVETHFEEVLRLPEGNDPRYDVSLWKWKYSQYTLSLKEPLNLDLSFNPLPEKKFHGLGGIGYKIAESPIFAFNEIDGICEYQGLSSNLPSSCTLHLFLDEDMVGSFYSPETVPKPPIQIPFEIPYGFHQLSLVIKSAEGTGESPGNLSFRLKSSTQDKIQIPATAYDDSSPTYDIFCATDNKNSYLVMPYNSYASYNLNIPESGIYRFGMKARNNPPGPILYHLEIDREAVGILNFFKKDNSWEIREFPLKLSQGNHVLSVYFISDIYTGAKKQSNENDSFLSSFYLQRMEGKAKIPDQRVALPKEGLVPFSRFFPKNHLALDQGGGKDGKPLKLPIQGMKRSKKTERTMTAFQLRFLMIPQGGDLSLLRFLQSRGKSSISASKGG